MFYKCRCRDNARGTWRHRAGSRNVDNTAICRAFSPLHPYGSVTVDVHGVAPIRHPLAIRDTPVAHTGEKTTPSLHHASGCAAHPSVLVCLLVMVSPHWMPVGSQALVGFQGRGFVDGVQPDFCHSLVL